MIQISGATGIGIDLKADRSEFGIAENPGAQGRLFERIRRYLADTGATKGFRLGSIGDDGELGLICLDGYWLVTYSERGSTRFLGIFHSFVDAADFFISKLVKPPRQQVDLRSVL